MVRKAGRSGPRPERTKTMTQTNFLRAIDRVVGEGGVNFSHIEVNGPFVFGTCRSRTTGEGYQVSLRSCSCPAGRNGRDCKHRAALALATGSVNRIVDEGVR